ncbi:hypothetical protein EXS74_02220 [Candidatus Woesearchaeota archaeon]|nr:hypothetical protein [Candidatus Woesearchaeota archaeon]
MKPGEALEELSRLFAGIAEQQKKEEELIRDTALAVIPGGISKVYMHVGSDRADRTLRSLLSERFAGNMLQSRVNYFGQLTENFETIEAYLSQADALVFLGYYLCDNTQAGFSIWNMMRLAERFKKPLYAGYRDPFCFQSNCPEIGSLQRMDARIFQTF